MVKFEDFELYRKELREYAWNLTRDNDKVKDLMQDTYLKFHEYLLKNEFRKPESLHGFLKVLLWRTWKDNRDIKNRRAQFSFFEVKTDFSESFGYANDYSTDYSIRQLFLTELINNIRLKSHYKEKPMSKRQKKIIELLLNDYQQYEVAKKLNCSRQSINHELLEIRERLPKWIKTLNYG